MAEFPIESFLIDPVPAEQDQKSHHAWRQLLHESLNAFVKRHRTGHVTTTGGSATETFEVPGVQSDDAIMAQMRNQGSNNVSIVSATCQTDGFAVTFSGDPGSDHDLSYFIIQRG
jgi:hypothetical protein